MKTRHWIFVGAAAAGMVGAGCHRVARPAHEGRGSFTFVDPRPPPGIKRDLVLTPAKPIERYVPARPLGKLANPLYPAVARGRREFAMVGVRITIDTKGRVSEVAPSMVAFSTPSQFAAEFRAAVEAAVAQWKFTPAEVISLETVSHPDGDYQRVKSRQSVEAMADVMFTFSATGEVTGGPGAR